MRTAIDTETVTSATMPSPAIPQFAPIDLSRCRSCRRCTKKCPLKPRGVRVDHSDPRCQKCLRCYEACRSKAIRLSGNGG